MVRVTGFEPAAKPRCATAWPCGGWPHSLPPSAEPLGDANRMPQVLLLTADEKRGGTFSTSSFLVRVTGFEPAASCSQSRRATSCATPGHRQKPRAPLRSRIQTWPVSAGFVSASGFFLSESNPRCWALIRFSVPQGLRYPLLYGKQKEFYHNFSETSMPFPLMFLPSYDKLK